LPIEVDGATRTLHVRRPADYGSDYPYPVVFMLHGAGGDGPHFRSFAHVEDNVDSLALVVYLDALPDDEGVTRWVDADLAFFDAALDEIGASHCVDQSRVFAAGFSNGGAFANALGCARRGTVRAIVSVAGGGPPDDEMCQGPVPALIAHGVSDETVPVESGRASRAYWQKQAACSDATAPALDDPHCSGFQGCEVPVAWCEHDEQINGGHGWPAFLDRVVWRFFAGV
jgi:polyhydroxybutyrate depolymerase